MAAVSGKRTAHATLTGSTADVVTLSHGAASTLRVINKDASTILYFTQDGTTAVAEADETYAVLPSQDWIGPRQGSSTISVVGSGNAYGVELI